MIVLVKEITEFRPDAKVEVVFNSNSIAIVDKNISEVEDDISKLTQ